MEDQKRRDQFVIQSGKSLISISNLIISQVVVVFFYSFLLVTFFSSMGVDGIVTFNIIVSLILLVLSVMIILKIRESGKNLINSVDENYFHNESTTGTSNSESVNDTVIKEDGSYEKYYQNGNLMEKGLVQFTYPYKKYGIYEEYYENGNLRVRGTYKNGKKDGLWEVYDESGQLTQTETY